MPSPMRRGAGACVSVLACAALGAPLRAAERPTVASINLCTDQLVLSLADPAQILSVSWLAADPEESMLPDAASRFPLNYGNAEELLRYRPDVVVGSAYTNGPARALLERLGYDVVAVEPANSIPDIERNLRLVAAAVGRPERGEQAVESLRARRRAIEQRRPPEPLGAVVLRPGGFTVGAGSLADRLMALAGLRNVAAERGLDRWGSLSMESLLRADPQVIVLTDYRRRQASLANAILQHPAVAAVAARAVAVHVPSRDWSCGLPDSLGSAELLETSLSRSRAP
jgi:iron complex transport system substrate-binding protein